MMIVIMMIIIMMIMINKYQQITAAVILWAIPRLDRSTVELQELPGPTLFSACNMTLIYMVIFGVTVLLNSSFSALSLLQELPGPTLFSTCIIIVINAFVSYTRMTLVGVGI